MLGVTSYDMAMKFNQVYYGFIHPSFSQATKKGLFWMRLKCQTYPRLTRDSNRGWWYDSPWWVSSNWEKEMLNCSVAFKASVLPLHSTPTVTCNYFINDPDRQWFMVMVCFLERNKLQHSIQAKWKAPHGMLLGSEMVTETRPGFTTYTIFSLMK